MYVLKIIFKILQSILNLQESTNLQNLQDQYNRFFVFKIKYESDICEFE